MWFGGVSQQGYTLEQLDPFGNLETLPYPLDRSYWTRVLSLLPVAFRRTHEHADHARPTPQAAGPVRQPRNPALPARQLLLDRRAVAAAVRLRHDAQERVVFRSDAPRNRRDRRITPRRQMTH